MATHTCDALIVSCIDFRFQKYIRDWTDKNLPDKTFDVIAYAGSTKELETVLKQIELSIKLHDVKQIVLMHHEECGAYGAESTPERHARDLKKARQAILATHPQIQFHLYYLHLDGTFEKVE
jgi:carbonic anhydrase